ncbi:MAG: NAD(P)-binding protein [Gemmatales bacterium]
MYSHAGPVIVCGLGRVGWPVLKYCVALGWKVIAIDSKARQDDPQLQGVEFIAGSYRDPATLEKARLHEARGIILLANDDLNNLAACLEIRRLHPTIRIIVRLFNDNLVNKLSKTINHVVALSSSRLSGPLLATTALSGDVLTRFHSGESDWQIERIEVEHDSILQQSTPQDLIREHPGISLLQRLPEQEKLQAQQQLLVAGPVEKLAQVKVLAQGDKSIAEWAGMFKRFGRTLWSTITEIEWPVKLAAIVFFSVIFTGSVICWLSGLADTLPRGLFRTLNIMVTSADLREQDYPAPWQHVFISFLKLSGLLLTAAFTALLTNYLVRARLRGVLSISRIPESGHIVLCGLGTVGMRVVEALREQKVPVVVLEKMEGGRFVAAARQLGATVLLSDGTVPASLQRANVARSRALVSATSSDLANVEIGLLAREQNPKLRVILRLDDAALASALKQTAGVRYAMALPQLIAPAFVLPLFGDRILNLFWLDQTLYLVMEVAVSNTAQGILNRCADELVTRLGCWILAKASQRQEPITAGQTLILVMPVDEVRNVLQKCYQL